MCFCLYVLFLRLLRVYDFCVYVLCTHTLVVAAAAFQWL